MAVETLPSRIICHPDPRLRRHCEPITVFNESLAALAQRMIELMHADRGVGLAAPQVGICRRLFVWNATGQEDDNHVFVNPVLSELIGSVEAEEGCLSLPDVRVQVRRARTCRVDAQDLQGRPISFAGEDLAARIWQHETDHLNGRLIIDLMNPTDRIANRKALIDMERAYQRRQRDKARR